MYVCMYVCMYPCSIFLVACPTQYIYLRIYFDSIWIQFSTLLIYFYHTHDSRIQMLCYVVLCCAVQNNLLRRLPKSK